jgi:hypothetical protein
MEGGHRFAQASSADSGSPATSIILLLEWVAIWNPSAIYYMSTTPSSQFYFFTGRVTRR